LLINVGDLFLDVVDLGFYMRLRIKTACSRSLL